MEKQQRKVISFDCYGTLIDWKRGVIQALAPLLADYHLSIPEEDLFALFSEADHHFTSGKYLTYREILIQTMKWIAGRLGINLYGKDEKALIGSFPNWEPFPDVQEALRHLKQKYSLVILSNIDDDLFSFTRKKLGVVFDEVITAYQIRSYKPAPGHFREALDRLGLKPGEMLHVAQSIYHDIEPCREIGIPNVWINRYGETFQGSDPPRQTYPSLEAYIRSLDK
ncbi:MAG TPA: haloacid dehalogenase type II [Bacteroidetes bacterium]|nr:haloacid dehalogenase type II [Bacteroidota bacterium]